ncbi:hypothetical protein BC628DRAFT_1402618 [Trametes gibbosa]|uniref:RING-type domain-containing protein n=1 Tax=Trametes gibbosa TaxID=160864 RepID=A0A6G6FQ95_9APHY|nr:hypothetical protein BC628DRAFT_1402618 [Trametes gibbosa]QIE48440.1 hypothetical protein [Trametes gibbosa]
MADARGIPLLSGPAPEYTANEPACRKCNKEFNILFARSRKCNHCGYAYCHSCSDFQALMPRRGSESGYDPAPVCAFCIELLQVTASGKGQLKQLPMAKLKRYAKAYNIDVAGVLEKDEFIERLVAARAPNGCLPWMYESHYRKNGVPNRAGPRPRGLFTRAMDAMTGLPPESPSSRPQQPPPHHSQYPPYQSRPRTTSGPSHFPRPDVNPRPQQQPQAQPQYHQQHYYQQAPHPDTRRQSQQQRRYAPPPGPPPQSSRPSNLNVPPPGRPRSASATGPSTPRARSPAPALVEVPSMDALLALPEAELGRLSIGVLKEILFKNHVNPGLVVEKGDLVARVKTLVEDERRERARHAQEEEEERLYEEEMRRLREEEEAEARAAALRAEAEAARAGTPEAQSGSVPIPASQGQEGMPPMPAVSTPPQTSSSPPAGSNLTPKAQAMASRLERTGLCVICQDEEANIAIVDCGHLALCRDCSDLIMKSTRECPLCRTRIVTESRLLRIFKT